MRLRAPQGWREAREGAVAQYIAPDGQLGVWVEVNCQTDFVARNDMFRAFAEKTGGSPSRESH